MGCTEIFRVPHVAVSACRCCPRPRDEKLPRISEELREERCVENPREVLTFGTSCRPRVGACVSNLFRRSFHFIVATVFGSAEPLFHPATGVLFTVQQPMTPSATRPGMAGIRTDLG